MNRQEFCELMAKAKAESGVGTTELALKMKMQPSPLRRFERGINNFNLEKLFNYLNALGCVLVLSNDKQTYHNSYESIPDWIASHRKQNAPLREFAEKIGCSFEGLSRAENRKTVISIDLFLKITNYLNVTVNISSQP